MFILAIKQVRHVLIQMYFPYWFAIQTCGSKGASFQYISKLIDRWLLSVYKRMRKIDREAIIQKQKKKCKCDVYHYQKYYSYDQSAHGFQ